MISKENVYTLNQNTKILYNELFHLDMFNNKDIVNQISVDCLLHMVLNDIYCILKTKEIHNIRAYEACKDLISIVENKSSNLSYWSLFTSNVKGLFISIPKNEQNEINNSENIFLKWISISLENFNELKKDFQKFNSGPTRTLFYGDTTHLQDAVEILPLNIQNSTIKAYFKLFLARPLNPRVITNPNWKYQYELKYFMYSRL